ncbi:hypothetical protein LIER_31226 [Lithospermum erythrorhizon]|uniref:Integrase catalytic domain-containing protein n=1 Tax=Lithospermum erythrorhizon TaxID=34254 RepID=A0AAV3RTY2_LITER
MCAKLGIEHRFAPVCYPQYNGQVEVMNMTIFAGIKKNHIESGTQWYKEVDRVLWSYRTTPSNSTGETPFSLVYGTKVVLPIEVCLPNIRQVEFDEKKNYDRMRGLLDFTDEIRDQILRRLQEQKWRMSRFYNRKVRKVIGPGTYGLEELSRKEIDHTWHGIYLKKYYV